MSKKSQEVNTSSDIILADSMEVLIAGKMYNLRRLNVKDVFTFSKIMAKALKTIGNIDIKDPTTLGLILMAGMAEEDMQVAGWCSSLIGVSVKEFMELPPEALGDLFDALPQHYDMTSFFAQVMKTIKTMGSLWQRQ